MARITLSDEFLKDYSNAEGVTYAKSNRSSGADDLVKCRRYEQQLVLCIKEFNDKFSKDNNASGILRCSNLFKLYESCMND